MSDHLTFHTRFTSADFDAQYNLRARRPDFEQTVVAHWINNSEMARETLVCSLDHVYGPGPKQKLDVFPCDDPKAPTLVYIHGGYWQSGDKGIYSFLAHPFVTAGAHVVVLGYDLCPAVTITQIVAQVRDAMVYLWRNAGSLGVNRERIAVMGHSAGGHLAQMIMGTDWSAFDPSLPRDLVKAGIPISPISYLEPIRLTQVLNTALRLDAAEVQAQSPMTLHHPTTNAPQLVVIGAAETDEFHRQARMYVEAFGTETRPIKLCIVPDVDHFDVVNAVTNPRAPVFRQISTLLGI